MGSRPFLDIGINEWVHDDMTRKTRLVVGVQWVNGTVRDGGNNHYGCWGVYLLNEDGKIESRHPWEITTLLTEEEQIKQLPNCYCSPDKSSIHVQKFDVAVPRAPGSMPSFISRTPPKLEVPDTITKYYIECVNCGKRTCSDDFFDLVKTQWIKIAGA